MNKDIPELSFLQIYKLMKLHPHKPVTSKQSHTCDIPGGRQNLPILRPSTIPLDKNKNLPTFQNSSNKKFQILKTMKRRKISL
jgi:hypothetical protein